MRLFLFVLSLLFASASMASVTVDGVEHGTGYLPRALGDAGDIQYIKPDMKDVPEAYDARSDGLVTPIKDQGSCGSCWAFARTKAFEAALIKAGVSTVDLSEQDTLVNDRYGYACSGGFMDGRFEVTYGQTTEALCPYRASGRYSCNGEKFAKATRWAMVGEEGRAPTVDELKAAIYQYGVLAVTVAASGSFNTDSEGRITRCRGRALNHMVTLVGYRPSQDGGTEFLIANSWGTRWGNEGFAWSKQGCNKLASVPGDAALFFYVE